MYFYFSPNLVVVDGDKPQGDSTFGKKAFYSSIWTICSICRLATISEEVWVPDDAFSDGILSSNQSIISATGA